MNTSGTFTITNNYLNEKLLPSGGWDYSTFGYGFGITFWSRLEIGYVCTIFYSEWSPRYDDPGSSYRFKITKNQDRHFYGKFQILREGDWGVQWLPSLAVGVSDPVTGVVGNTWGVDYLESDTSGDGNGYFNRLYIAATKHFNTTIGEFSGTIGYQYNKRTDYHLNAPCAAVTWRPVWLENRWFNPKFILEYDARTPNIGFIASVWDDRFEAMFELQNFQWISFGLRYKLRLKGSE